MIDRIKKIMEVENLSSGKFADEIGINNSRLSHYLSGRNNVSLEFVTGILERFRGINPDWLLFGRGDMYKSNESGVRQSQTQGDLFSSADVNDSVTKSDVNDVPSMQPLSSVEQEPKVQEVSNSIDNEDIADSPIAKNVNRTVEDVAERPNGHKTMEKIVVFYADGTFDCYFPNGKRI